MVWRDCMTKGYLLVAMGNDYVEQAYLCAKSIRDTQTINNVSIVTSDVVPEEYKSVFDHIIDVPWHDKESKSFYLTEHRWKVFHITPYEETVVLDTDMIFLDDVSHWWKYMSQHSLLFTTRVVDYRNNTIKSDYYRKAFTSNNLPDVYCAYHYFKKDDKALEYYNLLNTVCENWKDFYKVVSPKNCPTKSSMDLNHAICVYLSSIEDFTIDCLNFTHMKSHVQSYKDPSDSWTDSLPFYVNGNDVKIGNYRQRGVLHYTDDKFCKEVLQ